jgi:2'-5' RNA ligase
MPADVTELVAALDDYQGQPWTADRVHLVRSRLGATEQPRYTSLANWPLRAPPATGPATGPTAGGPVTTTG